MSPEEFRKQKSRPQPKTGLKQALEGVVERLREGLEEIARGLNAAQPQRVPIPIPVNRLRRR